MATNSTMATPLRHRLCWDSAKESAYFVSYKFRPTAIPQWSRISHHIWLNLCMAPHRCKGLWMEYSSGDLLSRTSLDKGPRPKWEQMSWIMISSFFRPDMRTAVSCWHCWQFKKPQASAQASTWFAGGKILLHVLEYMIMIDFHMEKWCEVPAAS